MQIPAHLLVGGVNPPSDTCSSIDEDGPSAENLRDVVEYCRDEIADLIHDIGGYEDDMERRMKELVSRCNDVLAKPVRNCDVGTLYEQCRRLDAFCDSHGHGFDGTKSYSCENCSLISDSHCELAWANMPYEEAVESGSREKD